MRKTINVKYEELNSLANKYKEESIELNSIQNELSSVLNSLNAVWNGIDSSNFVNGSKALITDLKNESVYLDAVSSFISKSGRMLSSDVEEGLSRLRSISNSYEIKR